LGFKVTCHTCGGTLGIEEYILATEADVSETLSDNLIAFADAAKECRYV